MRFITRTRLAALAALTLAAAPAAHAQQTLYVSNYGNNHIEKFTPGGVGSVFASTGLNGPYGLAFDSAGNLYAANNNNSTILKFTPGGVASQFANSSTGLSNPLFLAFAPTPEPSPLAALAIGILGVGALTLKARRRTA